MVARAAAANVVVDVATPPGALYACQPVPIAFHVTRPAGEGQRLRVSMNLPVVMPPQPGLLLTRMESMGTGVPCPPGGDVPPLSLMCGGQSASFTVTDSDDASPDVRFAATLHGTAAGSYPLPVQIACDAGCTQQPAAGTLKLDAYPLRAEVTSTPPRVAPGRTVVVQAVVHNGGSLDADGVQLDLVPPPPGADVVSVTVDGTGSGLPAALGTLAAGASRTVMITLRATTLPEGSVLAVNARVTGNVRGFACGSTSTTSERIAVTSLSLDKSADVATARPGDTIHYLVRLSPPAGGLLPAGANLVDALPPELALTVLRASLGAAAPVSFNCPHKGQVDAFLVDCPGPAERTPISVKLAGAVPLQGPFTVEIDAQVRPGATADIVNRAQLLPTTQNPALESPPARVKLPASGPFSLTLDRALAARGDLVPLRARIDTGSGLPGPAHVLLRLGRDLRPAGDARLLHDDGRPPDAIRPGERGDAIDLALPPLSGGHVVVALLPARLGVLTTPGRKTIEATLLDRDRAVATARVVLEVMAEPDFDLVTLAGTVFRDDNHDGKRSRGEPGLPGVTLAMDDGITMVTDGDGRYHVAGVRPGQRVLKLDGDSLPPASRATGDLTRVLSLTPGIVSVVDFPVAVERISGLRTRPGAELGPGRLEVGPAGVRYRLEGEGKQGDEAIVDGRSFPVDAQGRWSADVALPPGISRFLVLMVRGRAGLEIVERTVRRVEEPDGTGFVLPVREEPIAALTLSAVTGEGTLAVEGLVTPRLRRLRLAERATTPDSTGRVSTRVVVPAAPPAGAHALRIEVETDDGQRLDHQHTVRPPDRVALLVGIAEGTAGYVIPSGDGAGRVDGGLYARGRVALYARGRIKGRYLIEGGLDLDSSAIGNWRDLLRGDPTRAFRALDPDRFYPVYGDASTTSQRAPTRGPLYVKIGVDGSDLVVGNVQTGLTGVELGRYARTVTGARLDVVRAGPTPGAPPDTQVIVFGAWLPSGRAHDELRGTGGSLYFLSHRAVVEGSEQVRIEVRDAISERPIENRALMRGVDYEVDPLAGRVTLREPLSSTGPNQSLVRTGVLDGARSWLVIDYEYVVLGDTDDGAAGARAVQRLGPVRLGGTFASELRGGRLDWWMAGGDARLDLGKWGHVNAEFAHSSGAHAGFSRSDDGGLTFTPVEARAEAGNAWKVEADLHGYGLSLRPYARSIDRGFSDSAHQGYTAGRGVFQVGAEAAVEAWGAKLRLHADQRWLEGDDGVTRRLDAGGDLGRRFGRVDISLGARTLRQDGGLAGAAHHTDVAARLGVDVHARLTLHLLGQLTVERAGDEARALLARDSSRGALGATVRLPWDFTAEGEASYGAQGIGGLFGLRRTLGPDSALYGTFSLLQDRDAVVSSALAVGGRQRLGALTLFAEDQFRDGNPGGLAGMAGATGDPTGVATRSRAHLDRAGIELPLTLSVDRRMLLGASYERGEVTGDGAGAGGTLTRDAGSVHASYVGAMLQAQVKGEVRRDAHAAGDAPLQFLVSGTATLRPVNDFTVRAKVFYSRSALSTGTLAGVELATATEINVGFAWRPSWVDGAALFGRYAFLDDHAPPAQAIGAAARFPERAHVISLGGEARLVWRLSLSEKVAAKRREEDVEGASPGWLLLWVNRLSLHVTREWDAVVEYRLSSSFGPGQQTQHGVALEVNRLLVGHLRLGAGWNFSQVTDNELLLGRGGANGFFVRAQGYY